MEEEYHEKEYHGWFSTEQAKIIAEANNFNDDKNNRPYKIYLNKDNEEVMVTCISLTKEHGCKYSDIEYRGIVTKFVRSES